MRHACGSSKREKGKKKTKKRALNSRWPGATRAPSCRGLAETLWGHSEMSFWIAWLGWGWGAWAFLHWFPFPIIESCPRIRFLCRLASSPVLDKALSLAEKLQALEMRSMGLLERDLYCSRRWPQGGDWDGGGRKIIFTCYRSLPGLHVSGVSTFLFWAHELPKQALTYSYD